jgi:hypothetical protein
MNVQDVITFVSQNVPFKYYPNQFPKSDNEDCGFVRLDGGQSPGNYILGLKTPSIQIVVRHQKGSEAERISKDIWNLFHGKEHFTIGNAKVYFSSCDQSEPIFLDKDNNGRTIYSINVTCKISE